MSEVLTLDEINARYQNEWVLIGDPELDEQMEVIRGRVLYHGKDRDEVHGWAARTRPGSFASHDTGPVIEEGLEFIL